MTTARARVVVLALCLLAVLVSASPREAPAASPRGVAGGPALLRDPAREIRVRDARPADPDHPGALALRGGPRAPLPPAPLAPALEPPTEDWVRVPDGPHCRVADPGPPLLLCAEPIAGPPRRRVVVVGDSHARQYAGALEALAAEHHWQVVHVLRGACPFSTESETAPGAPGCLAWNAAARAAIVAMRPDLVVTTASRDVRIGPTETTPPGFVRAWRELAAAGVRVLAIRDNPRFDRSPADCVRRLGRGTTACDVPRAAVLAPVPPYRLAPGVPPTVSFFDPTDHLCTPTVCPAVVGNVVVHFDANHLSATFTRSLGPVLAAQLVPLLEGRAAPPDGPRAGGR